MSLQKTNAGSRFHIGFFGRVNVGKSSLINALVGRELSIVSEKAGTTTDPVYKSMEIQSLGPCLLMDTAGFMDQTELGRLRMKKTKEVMQKSDLAVLVVSDLPTKEEVDFIKDLGDTPLLVVLNKVDQLEEEKKEEILKAYEKHRTILVSSKTKEGIDKLLQAFLSFAPKSEDYLFEGMVKEKDLVLLVIPQDIAAPKNRLILPQVQAIRELLDRSCLVLMVKLEGLEDILQKLNCPPKLIVADSSVFQEVFLKKPEESKLTSFSILFAKMKGDLSVYLEGIEALKHLKEGSKVLIAEACSHAPTEEDIGRVKIPNMIRKAISPNIECSIQSGTLLPDDIEGYDLIIQCGACMLNGKAVKNRIKFAKEKSIPITNYGMAIAYFQGILDKISY